MFLLYKNLGQGSNATPDTQQGKGRNPMARPQKAPHEKATEQVNIRLSPVDLARLRVKAARAGMTVSDFVRAAALNKSVTVTETSAPDFLTRNELRRIGSNLNQVAHVMNAGGISSPDRIEALVAKLDTLFDRWLDHGSEGREIGG